MKIKFSYYFLFILSLFCFYCASSNMYIRSDIDYTKYKRIAILPLSDFPNKEGSGAQFSDLLSLHLINSNYNIIDRSQTTKILEEQALGQSGVIDEKTAPAIGRLLGVQALLTGSVTEFQTVVTSSQLVQGASPTYLSFSRAGLTLKMIDAETGQIIWAGSANGHIIGENLELSAAEYAIKSILEKFKSLNLQSTQNISQNNKPQSFKSSSETLLPHFRSKYPKYSKFSDEQIVIAFRKSYPQYKDKSDIWIINFLEAKYK